MRDAYGWFSGNHQLKMRSLSSEYNCLGLVFASRRTWVDEEMLHAILNDDGFRPIEQANVKPGDLLVYEKDAEFSHIGMVISHEPIVEPAGWDTLILSQWGHDGEYLHK